MANGLSRVNIGSFLEELDETIDRNVEEPKESVLETIIKPKYELSGLSSYSRAVGKLSKILDAPVEKSNKKFKELGVSRLYNPATGMMMDSIVEPGSPLAGEKGMPMPSTTLSMLAPLTGDPETGKYSNLDVAFGALEATGYGAAASKAIKKLKKPKAFDDMSDSEFYAHAREFQQRRYRERMLASPDNLDATGDMDEVTQSIENLTQNGSRPMSEAPITEVDRIYNNLTPVQRESFRDQTARGEMVDRVSEAFAVPPEATQRFNEIIRGGGGSRNRGTFVDEIQSGKFKTTGLSELEDIEYIAYKDLNMKKGVEILPPESSYKNLDVLELPEDVGVIVQRKAGKGERDRNIIIGRQQREFDSKVKLYSVDTDNTLKAKFEFNISNDVDDKGRNIIDGISFFKAGNNDRAGVHSGLLLRDFIEYSLNNNWVIKETNLSLDSLYAMINQAVKQKARIIFSGDGRVFAGVGRESDWSKKAGKYFIDEKGDFIEDGMDTVMRDFEELIERARKGEIPGQKGEIVGSPDPSFPDVSDLDADAALQDKMPRYTREVEIKIRKEVTEETRNMYPELTGEELKDRIDAKLMSHAFKATDRNMRKGFGLMEYNSITIEKLTNTFAGVMGMTNKEFLDFLSYDPNSVESQVFDNEIMF